MLDQILALVAAQVKEAYSQGVKDGMSQEAAPLLALEGTAQVQALLAPPAPSAPPEA